MNAAPGESPTQGEADLGKLDKDHPGFRDPVYRARRNEIARIALGWKFGDAVPRIDYSDVEHGVWKTALENLTPLHARYACAEFKEAWPEIRFPADRIPSFAHVNERLEKLSGFSMVPVA